MWSSDQTVKSVQHTLTESSSENSISAKRQSDSRLQTWVRLYSKLLSSIRMTETSQNRHKLISESFKQHIKSHRVQEPDLKMSCIVNSENISSVKRFFVKNALNTLKQTSSSITSKISMSYWALFWRVKGSRVWYRHLWSLHCHGDRSDHRESKLDSAAEQNQGLHWDA